MKMIINLTIEDPETKKGCVKWLKDRYKGNAVECRLALRDMFEEAMQKNGFNYVKITELEIKFEEDSNV